MIEVINLKCHWVPGEGETGTLTIAIGDKSVYVNVGDIRSEKFREDFIKTVVSMFPAVNPELLRDELVLIATKFDPERRCDVPEMSEDAQLTLEYKPFPTEVLPTVIREFVEQGAAALDCDPAYIALPLLAALAAAIGNTRRIVLRRDWIEPCVLWTACVGDSGTLKSPAQDLALAALRDRHSEAMKDFQGKMEANREAKLEYERKLQHWKSSKSTVPPPPAIEEPILVRYTCSDITIEALSPILQKQPRGILLERDELNGWLKSFDSYRGGRGGDSAHWLTMHGARSLTVDRKTGDSKTIYVPRAATSITGGIQPQILTRSLGGEYIENGMAARFLLAMPPRQKRSWTESEIGRVVKESVDLLFRKILELDFNPNGEPMDIPLSPEAKKVWIEFFGEHAEVSFQLTNPALKAAYAKLEGAAARLTLVIHCIRAVTMEPDVQSNLVDEISAKMGVTLARWFRNETTRIYGLLGIGGNDRPQGENLSLVELIRKRGGKITPRELQQSSRRYRKSPKSAETALQTLVDRELGCWERSSPDEGGGRPTKFFVLK